MSDENPKYEPGDKVTITAEVVKVQANDSLIVRMSNGSHSVFKPEQITKPIEA